MGPWDQGDPGCVLQEPAEPGSSSGPAVPCLPKTPVSVEWLLVFNCRALMSSLENTTGAKQCVSLLGSSEVPGEEVQPASRGQVGAQ